MRYATLMTSYEVNVAYFLQNNCIMKKQDLRVIKLQIQYATLSEICEHFTLNSKHEAYIHINKKMDEILSELKKIKK